MKNNKGHSQGDIFTQDRRKSLDQIIRVPSKIQSVYSLTRHIWQGEEKQEQKIAIREGKFRKETIEELLIDPVRDFFIDFLDHIKLGEGQGWWVMADRGSGKSHLLSAATILALGKETIWNLILRKEKESGTEKRESLEQFVDAIIPKKIFPVTRDLVGVGGKTSPKGLIDYLLESAAEIYEIITGKPLPIYPEEYLAERFLSKDISLYRDRLKEFLQVPRNLEGLPKYTFDSLLDALQDPSAQKDAGSVLWKFYRDDLGILQLDIPVERIERLESFVRRVLSEGYDGVLFVLDEVSEYMETDRDRRYENEDTLLVLGEKLAKDKKLPVWTICAAQTYIESQRIGSKIIAPDRLKQYELLRKERSYYEIVLSRTRKIENTTEIQPYYDFYKRIAPWPELKGLDDFQFFFPFYPEAIDIIRIVSFKLTTTRSALHFLHTGLQRGVSQKSKDLLSLWNVFEELIQYEEAPSGGGAGVLSIRTKFPSEYRAYEMAQKALQKIPDPYLTEYRDRAQKILNTLFLYHLAGRPPLKPLDVLNAVLEPRNSEATIEENEDHYAVLLEKMEKRIPQIVQKEGAYYFQEIETTPPDTIFEDARRELAEKETVFNRYYNRLLTWKDDERKQYGFFAELPHDRITPMNFFWHNQERRGRIGLMDLSDPDRIFLPDLNTSDTDDDLIFLASKNYIVEEQARKILDRAKEHRAVIWVPRTISNQEKEELIRILSYLKVKDDFAGKQPEIVEWADKNVREDIPRGLKIIEAIFAGGKAYSLGLTIQLETQGGLRGVYGKVAGQVLDTLYQSKSIECPRQFKKDDAAKLINGIIRYGEVRETRGANASAADNFAVAFKIAKATAPKKLDPSESPFYKKMLEFIQSTETSRIPIRTFYKRFMGNPVGLTRRMVDIYLLCLVQQGILVIEMKDGKQIDRSNIHEYEFSTTLLNNLSEAARPRAPEFWEQVAPFISIMTGFQISDVYDDRETSDVIRKMREIFEEHSNICPQISSRVETFFSEIGLKNPYQDLLNKFSQLFKQKIPEDNRDKAVVSIGRGLVDVFNKELSEIDASDLENFKKSWSDYLGLYHTFDIVKDEVRTALKYSKVELPEEKHFDNLREKVNALLKTLGNIESFLIDESEFVTRLQPPLRELKKIYFDLYREAHSKLLLRTDDLDKTISEVLNSKDWKIAEILAHNIPVLKTPFDKARQDIEKIRELGLRCEIRDDATLQKSLESGPLCLCGLEFKQIDKILNSIDKSIQYIGNLPEGLLVLLSEFFKKDEVINKLTKSNNKTIKSFLQAKSINEIKEILRGISSANLSKLASEIKSLLEDIQIKRVNLSNFKPKKKLISQNEIDELVKEFRSFINTQFQNPNDVIEIVLQEHESN